MRVVFLGTGTSHGIPAIGCSCPVCASRDPRDWRYRSSVLIERGGASLLVDSGPEFRLQALRAHITRLDAMLLTHAHADHLHGLDDVRPLSKGAPLRVYGNGSALRELRERFAYIFRETQAGGGKPRLDLVEAESGRPLEICGIVVLPILIYHGKLPVLGWRIGDFAYLTDCSRIPEESFDLLSGVRVAVIDGLRPAPHPTHFSVDEAIGAARRIGASQTWLTHICHDASHEELERLCAERGRDVGARPAWDGLELDLE
jgi:phosphoribosyl 1,2-cyclic phosphate phosphodiesterase